MTERIIALSIIAYVWMCVLDQLKSLLWSLTAVGRKDLRNLSVPHRGWLTMTFVYIDNLMTWANAQTYCRLHYTDLASVRNMPENQKIDEVVPAGVKVWIGLFRDSWKWTNGSNSSLRYWTIIEPNNLMGHESCVAANFLLNAKWEDWTCDSMKEFVCYIGKPCFRKSGL
uniref:C-type lectin domain-containing protein n=1 Tax=Maylandia zebra TaxID=106582 RepID=A0A3P9DNP0_9CICH